LRCDANISIRKKGSPGYGNRCEVKNLNSIRNLQRAIQVEFRRQCELTIRGEVIEQNTLNFDAATGLTTPLRSKEMANDYRYFPEPDLPPVLLTEAYVRSVAAELPELPEQLVQRLQAQYGLSGYDAGLIGDDQETARYFQEVITNTGHYKAAANWINGPVRSRMNETGESAFPVSGQRLAELIDLIGQGKLSFSVASRDVFPAMIENPGIPAADLAARLNVLISAGEDEMDRLADEVLKMFPEKIREYKNGKKGVLGLFMGEFMKRSQGKADPKSASRLIETKLEQIQ
ncbi:MAG TPA: Asp-tRNA(Asn)/Glu-tRNA(Gln) amidotransferase GatCAB subunit B, partial [Sphingobacteriaceae bacterium]